jgi:predicted  nucleic acid-binding Zn-ribbon protein
LEKDLTKALNDLKDLNDLKNTNEKLNAELNSVRKKSEKYESEVKKLEKKLKEVKKSSKVEILVESEPIKPEPSIRIEEPKPSRKSSEKSVDEPVSP